MSNETEGILVRLLRLRENGTTVRAELRAGLITFLMTTDLVETALGAVKR